MVLFPLSFFLTLSAALSLSLFLHLCLYVSLSPPADIISTVEFNHTGELLATGDKGGRVVIFQREPEVDTHTNTHTHKYPIFHSSFASSDDRTPFPSSYSLD